MRTPAADPTIGLIGRKEQVGRVRRVLEAGYAGPLALLITGDPGAGKSRLLDVAVHLARSAGPRRIVAVRGIEAKIPLLTVEHLLSALRAEVNELPDEQREAALAVLGGQSDVPLDLLTTTVTTLLAVAARRVPLLVLADDADLCDRDSLRVLGGVAMAMPAAPVTFLLTGAPDGVSIAPGLVPVLPIPPLSASDAAQLLDAQPVRAVGEVRAAILRQAAGIPAAVIQLAASASPGRPRQTSAGAQVDDLPDATRQLLLYAAAAAQDTAPQTLMKAAGRADMSAWAPAVGAGLVSVRLTRVTFRDPLVGPTIYQRASADERRRAHHDLAAVVGDELERVRHLAASTTRRDESVAAALEAAADVGIQRGALFDAISTLRLAADRSPQPAQAARRYARAVMAARDFGAPQWVGDLHAKLTRLTPDPTLLGRATRAAAISLARSGRQREAFDLLDALVRDAPPPDPADLLAVVDVAAIVAALSGMPEHRRALGRMLATAEEAQIESTPRKEVTQRFIRSVLDPNARAGRQFWESELSTGETTNAAAPGGLPDVSGVVGDPVEAIQQLMMLGTTAWHEDEPAISLAMMRRAIAVRHRWNLDGAGLEGLPVLVGALIDAGEWHDAERALTETSELAIVLGLAVNGAIAEALHVTVRALRGQAPPAARTWPPVSLPENRALQVRQARAQGVVAISSGDYGTAYRHLRTLFDQRGEAIHPFHSLRALADLALAAARTDQREDARVVLERARAACGPTPTTRMRLLLHHSAALLEADGDIERHFRLATVDPAGEDWPYERAMARLHYGEWLRRRRRPLDARALLSAALETFDRLGAQPAAELARLELRASGEVSERATPSALDVLTPQQREIVLLAAQGLTNKEIAERLFLSPRTVGAHLYSVYPKLGITRRQELRNVLV